MMSKRRRLPSRVLGWATCIVSLGPSCSEYMPIATRGDPTTATGGHASSSDALGGATGSLLATSSELTTSLSSDPLGLAGSTAAPSASIGGSRAISDGGSSAEATGGARTTQANGAAAGSSSTTPGAAVIPTATVSLDAGTTHQTLVGFGAAIAWYLATLTEHSQREELYQILFADLGLDILRFRNTYGRSEFAGATREKTILDAATTSLGRRPTLLLTSWSPPAALKANAVEKCNGESNCTLNKTANGYVYADFAEYWLNAVTAYTNAGVAPDWVSIQNEPDFIPPSWEGCKFAATETISYPSYGKALEAVHARFSGLSNRPKLIGPETLGVHWGRMETYLPALDKTLLWAAAHHLYERGNDEIWDWRIPGPDSFLSPMQSVKSVAGALPILQTEFQTDEDQGIEGGFETAWLIHNSLVAEEVSAWLYWDLVWVAGHGLVSLPDTSSYAIRDQYYSLRHYALYTDPGDVRIGATASRASIRASAFRSPDQRRLTVIVLNTGANEESVGLNWGSLNPVATEVYRTTYIPGKSERWLAQPALQLGSGVILPSRSISTIVLRY